MKQIIVSSMLLLMASPSAFADSEAEQILKKFKTYGKKLKVELVSGMKSGPQNAVNIYKEKTPKITKQISTNKILIGHINHKPRNTDNKIRKWMKTSVQQYLDGKSVDEMVKVKIDTAKTGYLMPIKTGALCLTCHGENVSLL